MNIFKTRKFKLSDTDQSIFKTAIQKPEFLASLKKLSRETGKKSNFCVSTLCRQKIKIAYFENGSLSQKLNLRLKQNLDKKWESFNFTRKTFCCRHQKMLVIQFSYIEIVRYAFFSKKKKHSFFHRQTVSLSFKSHGRVWQVFSVHGIVR